MERDRPPPAEISKRVIIDTLLAAGTLAALYQLSNLSFGRRTKDQIKDEQGGRCADCGTKTRLEAHHRVPQSMGGSDERSNGVGLCGPKANDCHEKWDRLALEDGIIYPGIPIENAPRSLFRRRKKR